MVNSVRFSCSRGVVLVGPIRLVAVVVVMLVPAAVAPAVAQDRLPFPDIPVDAYYAEPVEALAQGGTFVGTECGEGFCPHEPIDRATMAVWTVRVLDRTDPVSVTSTRFGDVDPSHPYAAFVERFADLGGTAGCNDGTVFCPDADVTRAQMAVFLARAFDLPDGLDPGFSDVPPAAWYSPAVSALAGSGITEGCKDGTVFCPDATTTRAQMATFLHRAMQRGTRDSGLCRPMGTGGTTAGFPLPDWAVPSTGTVRVAVLFVDFPDASADHSTEREAEPNLKQVEDYFEHASYGKLDLEFGVLHGWLRLEHGYRQYRSGEANIIAEAVRLADDDFDFTGYQYVMIVAPSSHFSRGYARGRVDTDEGQVARTVVVNSVYKSNRNLWAWGNLAAHELGSVHIKLH